LNRTAYASSAHEALQSVKRRSIEDRENGGDGWVRATPEEHEGFKALADDLRRARGRPRRDPAGPGRVEGLRFSEAELALVTERARQAGFARWRDWARKRLLEEDPEKAS
jgi:hypothetical protein